ncbi:MAG: hypothetical protein ACREOM_05385 [Candidatus Dormibacteraceae bacterium]
MEPGSDQRPPPAAQTRFSADGLWWWNGAEWKPAISPDRLWRWNGQAWEPSVAAAKGAGIGVAIGLTLAMFAGVLVLVSIITVVVLLSMGGQIANVFSNVLAAMSGS